MWRSHPPDLNTNTTDEDEEGKNENEDGKNEDEDEKNEDEDEKSEDEDEKKKTYERVYGGCEGPDSMYVKIISSDGHEFIVKREHALISVTIEAMLSGPGQFAENETNEITFREMPSHVLEKVCMFFAYKFYYTGSPITEVPVFPVTTEVVLELARAADFLAV